MKDTKRTQILILDENARRVIGNVNEKPELCNFPKINKRVNPKTEKTNTLNIKGHFSYFLCCHCIVADDL